MSEDMPDGYEERVREIVLDELAKILKAHQTYNSLSIFVQNAARNKEM